MTLSINTNVASQGGRRQLAQVSAELNDTFTRLSTGLRIVKPGDDPAGNQIADTLKADAKIATTAIQNANTAISYTSIADSSLSTVSGLLTRMAELAEQSANGVFSNTQRSALSNEFSALGSEIDRIAKTTEFNGQALLSAGTNVTLQVGLNGGANSQLTLRALTGTLESLGLAQVGSSALTFSIIGTTTALAESASRVALDAVKGALGSLNATRGSIGATESRLSAAIDNLSGLRDEFVTAESRIRDADIAAEVSEMIRLQVLQQANTAVLAQANQQTSIALSLLG